ncbi:MAG: hypothetical protein JWO53_687 [Chlamydiia bacterium]|nr:hypothetical protein [Chlamydiia bacterium]
MQSVAYETTLTNSMARLQLTSSASTATPTSKKSFTHLSEEIILAIMHFLQNKELFMTTECDSSVKNFCLTARRFYQIRAEYIKSSKSELLALTALAIKYRNEIPPSLYKKLEIYGKSISKLNFTMNPLKKENEEAFCSCFRRPPAPLPVPRVLTYQSLPILFPHLTALSLGACGLGDRHLCILSANTSLTALDLTGNSGITDDGIAHFKVVT